MNRQRQQSRATDEPHQCCGPRPSRGYPLLIFFILVTMVIVMSAAITPITPSNIAAAHERSGCDGATVVRHLAFVDEGRTDPVTIEIARAEVESIWATAGVRLIWVSGAPGVTPRPDAYVVLRAGRANATRQAAMMRSELSSQLGWVRFNRQGGHSHVVEVSLANVRLSLMYAWHDNNRLLFQPNSVQIVVMGRALGRVMAHEFGHWLLGRGHEAEGLMKAELRPQELMAAEPPRLPRAWTDQADMSDPRITRLRALCG